MTFHHLATRAAFNAVMEASRAYSSAIQHVNVCAELSTRPSRGVIVSRGSGPLGSAFGGRCPTGSAHLPPLNVRNLQPSGCAFSSAFRKFVNRLSLPGRRLSRTVVAGRLESTLEPLHDSSASLLVAEFVDVGWRVSALVLCGVYSNWKMR